MSFNCAEIDKLNTLLSRVTKKFLRACEQVQAMNKKLANLCHIYGEMEQVCGMSGGVGQQPASDQRPFNYNMMLSGLVQQIESVRDIKQVYVVYARRKADEITSIQSKLYGEQIVLDAYKSQQQQNSYMDHSQLVVMTSPTESSMFDESTQSTLDQNVNDAHNNQDDDDDQYFQQNSHHFINPIEALLDEDPMDDDDDTESSERLVQYDTMMNQSELQFVDNPVF